MQETRFAAATRRWDFGGINATAMHPIQLITRIRKPSAVNASTILTSCASYALWVGK
jgi:hypothetical protein